MTETTFVDDKAKALANFLAGLVNDRYVAKERFDQVFKLNPATAMATIGSLTDAVALGNLAEYWYDQLIGNQQHDAPKTGDEAVEFILSALRRDLQHKAMAVRSGDPYDRLFEDATISAHAQLVAELSSGLCLLQPNARRRA